MTWQDDSSSGSYDMLLSSLGCGETALAAPAFILAASNGRFQLVQDSKRVLELSFDTAERVTLLLPTGSTAICDACLTLVRQQERQLLAIGWQPGSPYVLQLSIRNRSEPLSSDEWLAWLKLAERFKADIGWQPPGDVRRVRLACFDMDSTLIQVEVIDELAAQAGCATQVRAITELAMAGELDFQQSFERRLRLLAGMPSAAVDKVLAQLPLMTGAQALFGWLTAIGVKTCIVSGGFDVFARQVQQWLGIDQVFANQLSFENEQLTGRATAPIVDAQFKAAKLRELAAQFQVPMSQTLAVGDGANDLPMLASAGTGIAFRAKPFVARSARIAINYGGLERVPYFLGYCGVDSDLEIKR